MAGKANPCGKTRPVEKPYEIWTSRDGSWEHRVLKKWQADDNKPFARWFVAVKSPFTYGGWEYSDSYVKDVKSGNTRTYVDPTLANATLIAAAPVMYADLCAVRDYLLELYDEGNAKAGEYAASLGITIEQAEGRTL